MKRMEFLRTLGAFAIGGWTMQLNDLKRMTDPLPATTPMPVLFFGHGSPMNAIEDNEFARGWQAAGKSLPKPAAILCISAHWETEGTFVTALEKPPTIHDFYGFPKALFEVEYPAPGSPALATETAAAITSVQVGQDRQWGLDHGCWSVLKHVYPAADVPVVQLSLDQRKTPQWHYDLARQLSALRRKGVLIIGSGNIVHNLRMMDWNSPLRGFDWAQEASHKLHRLIREGDHRALCNYAALGSEVALSVPTPEHFLPLLYILGLQEPGEQPVFFNDKTIYGSISMTSVRIGGRA